MRTKEEVERLLSNEARVPVNIRGKFSQWSKEEQEAYLEKNRLTELQLQTLKAFKEYYEDLPSSRGGKNRTTSVWNAVQVIRKFGLFLKELGILDYKDAKKEDIIKYIRSLGGRSDSTRSSYKQYIRRFYKWIYGIEEKHSFPDVVKDPRLVPEKRKNKKKPSDLLTQEEILKLLDHSWNYRNRSIIMLSLGEGGLRAGEIVSLNLGSVEFDAKGCKVWIEQSKSKERYVRIIKGEPYLREYINKEYQLDKSDPHNPLFYSVRHGQYKGKRLRNSALGEMLKRVGKSAGIKKRIYTHLGRAINISILNKKGMSAEISSKRFGITPGTLRQVYLTIDDKDVDEVYSRLEGKMTDEERKEAEKEEDLLMPKSCPRCNTIVPKGALYCNCGMILDTSEAMRIQQRERESADVLRLVRRMSKISPENLDKFFETLEKIES